LYKIYYRVSLLGCCAIIIERAILLMVSGEIKVAMMVSTGIRVTKAITNCVLSNSNCKIHNMLSINNGYDYSEREKTVLELYKQGKGTRDIAKEQRMSLRDISIVLRKNQASHSIAITKDNGNGNNNCSNDINIKSPNQIATQAYKLFSEGKKPFEVAIELGIREAYKFVLDRHLRTIQYL
jgi:hypothetical protein